MTTGDEEWRTRLVALGLIVVAILARLVPHPPNVTPLVALALFGGAVLPKRWTIALPLAAIVASDVVIGMHDTVAFTWTAAAFTGLIGWWVRRSQRPRRILVGALGASFLFFIVTNVGVWLVGDGGTMYAKTPYGLWQCFVAALPFFRNSLMGDLVYTAAIFSLYHGIARLVPFPEVARSR